MASPTPQRALESSRVAREAARLDVAVRALNHAFAGLSEDPSLGDALAAESEILGRELAVRGASLGALSLWLRAQDLGKDQATNLGRLIKNYSTWRPQPKGVGAPRNALTAGASGAFWIDRAARARIVVLSGGITGEGTEAMGRVLRMACEDVDWVFVDLSGVSFIDSSGLAIAVKISKTQHDRGGGVMLFGLSSNLTLLVETLGLDQFLNPVPALGDALLQASGRATRP